MPKSGEVEEGDFVKNGVAEATPEKIEEMLRHHKYAITHCKDGKYYTYVINRDKTRKQIKRNTYEEMISALLDFYNEQLTYEMKEDINVKKEINVYDVVPGRYTVSVFGEIKDLKTKDVVEQFIRNNHGNYRGHYYANLKSTNGQYEDYDVSKIVMAVFNGYPPEDMENPTIDHINKDSLDNYFRNLRWLERDSNAALRNNMQDGENNSQAILTRDDVQHICNLMVKTNLNNKEIGDMYGVSRWTISDIRNKKTWKHVSLFFEFDPR